MVHNTRSFKAAAPTEFSHIIEEECSRSSRPLSVSSLEVAPRSFDCLSVNRLSIMGSLSQGSLSLKPKCWLLEQIKPKG